MIPVAMIIIRSRILSAFEYGKNLVLDLWQRFFSADVLLPDFAWIADGLFLIVEALGRCCFFFLFPTVKILSNPHFQYGHILSGLSVR